VHHRAIQIDHQPDATIFQFIIPTLITGPTTNTTRLSPRYEGKTRGCYWSRWAPEDGREDARNMLSCK